MESSGRAIATLSVVPSIDAHFTRAFSIMIDRRAVITGLAAVAIAGVPPARTVPLIRVARVLTIWDDDLTYYSNSPPGFVMARSRWHVHAHNADAVILRHCNSGLFFGTDPECGFDYIWLARRADEPAPSVAPETLRLIARAAFCVACGASYEITPPHFRSYPPLSPYHALKRPIIEGAPPLPLLAA